VRLKEMGGDRRRKGQTGQRPVRGNAATALPNALGSRELAIVRSDREKGREGRKRRETLFFREGNGESLRGPKAQESTGPDPT
jgi:hypothetical protein